jgi:hemerythrin-like domain-containing protein
VKRSDALRDLSDDHHEGLVLARAASRATEADREATWSRVVGRFAVALEPHFRIEEEWLLPPMERAGAEALVGRTRDEHTALRSAVAPDGARSLAALHAFGALLHDHIRFEERALFAEAEARLDAAALAAVADACARWRAAR